MANIDSHAPGSFCWIELGTTDQGAAKRFYATLFGWSANDVPIGPGEIYTLFELNGRQTGACYTLKPDARTRGIPPHWLAYVCVTDADDIAARADAAGGQVTDAPFDVAELGRMAVLRDPTGAVLAAWQPKTHGGTGIEDVPGTLCWADLMTPDQATAAKFYEAVFGWQTDPGKDNSGYLHVKVGEQHIGGIPPAGHRNPNAPPHWLLYFQVEDCDTSTATAKTAGANIHMAPTTMEGVGRWSVMADPQGAVFALFQRSR